MEELLNYLKSSNIWLVAGEDKAPKRLDGTANNWNVKGFQFSLKDTREYLQRNPMYHAGLVTFQDEPLLVLDIDKITPEGMKYIHENNTFPLPISQLSFLNKKNKACICEWSLSGQGLHIYILLSEPVNIPNISQYKCPMCDKVEVFKGNKFVVFTGKRIKDFKFTIEETPETPETTMPQLEFNSIDTLKVFTRKTTTEKLLNYLLTSNMEFKLLFEKGELIKEDDIDIETLQVKQEQVTDISQKVYRFISILVGYTQHFTQIDTIFKQSYFYTNTKWGLEHKWERLISKNNNSNPVLAAYNNRVQYAKSQHKPICTGFKEPYTAEVTREVVKETKQLLKEEARLTGVLKVQTYIQEKINENLYFYDEYKKLDSTFEVFDVTKIDDDFLEDNELLSKMYWNIYPYKFAINNDSNNDWVIYNLNTNLYETHSRKQLLTSIVNFFMPIFPSRSHKYRESLANGIIGYYETLNKPIINTGRTNVYLHIDETNDEGLYYRVTNGILDVYGNQLKELTPNFFSYTSLPFDIDDNFLIQLAARNSMQAIHDTAFEKFLFTSFPKDSLTNELLELETNDNLQRETSVIFKPVNSVGNIKIAPQLIVLQRMLGYTLLPRTICNSDKCLILYGVAGSGKSTLAKLLGYLLTGKKNLSGLTTSFCAIEKNQYALAPFKTTPLLVVNELPDRFSNDIRGTLNALISGESVDINEKFKTNCSMQIPAKILLIGNVLPKISDTSGSLARRSIIVNFEYNVSKTNQAIENIDEELIKPENLRAFFLFCLNGALDYLSNPTPVVSKVGYELTKKMEAQNSPIEELLEHTIEYISEEELKEDMLTKNYAVPKTVLFAHLKDFVDSSVNSTNVTPRIFSQLRGVADTIAEIIGKHFNEPTHVMYAKLQLNTKNKYYKYSKPVDAYRGIRLKEFRDNVDVNDELKGVF